MTLSDIRVSILKCLHTLHIQICVIICKICQPNILTMTNPDTSYKTASTFINFCFSGYNIVFSLENKGEGLFQN